jgi:oligopeptide transport system permease protein
MKVDEGSERLPTHPEHIEAFSTAGSGLPPMPPSEASIKDLGPYSDTSTRTDIEQQVEAVTEGQSLSPLQASLRRLGRDRRAMVCLTIIVLMVLVSFVGPLIYAHIGPVIQGGPGGTTSEPPSVYHEYTHQELTLIDNPPSAAFPLGNDQLGRDILARLMAGVKVSVEVAFIVILFDVILGLVVGTLAGYHGGWIDAFLARFTDLMFAFPQLLFAIIAAATLGPIFSTRFGPTGRLVLVSLALGITVWPQMARYVRGQTLQLKEQQFVEAAHTVGTSTNGIILRHIVPNLLSIVVTAATLDVVGIIIGEATLSLLHLGVEPPGASLGLMISDGATRLYNQYTEVLFPAITLAILVLCFSFLGDGVSDAFNPRRKD